MKKDNYEVIIPTKQELRSFLNKFEVPNQKNYILYTLKNMCENNGSPMVLRKSKEDEEYSILILDNSLSGMENYIRTKDKLKIDFNDFDITDYFTYDLLHLFRHRVVEYEDDVKLHNENNFEDWFDKIKGLKNPKVENVTSPNIQSYYVESLYTYLFGYEKLFLIPGYYKCTEITIPYDDVIDIKPLSQEAFSNLEDLIKEKTIREVIKVKEGFTVLPLNIPNMKNISFIPTDRKYTKNDLEYLNQRKIKELCYYLKLGYDANQIKDTGLYGKNLIYNNTRKLLSMGIFSRDEINIKFPENDTEFLESFHRKLMHRKWKGMLDRCNNEENISYPNYGGRGISVCPEWSEPDFGFENYYRDITENIGHWPGNGYSIDRIKNNGNYTLGNVRWATVTEQNNNRSFKRNKK